MKLSEYAAHDATGLARLVASGEVTPEELAGTALDGVHKVNERLNAIVSILEQPYREWQGKARGPFHGVPFFMKDLGAGIAGIPQENGSRFSAGLVFPRTTNFAQSVLDAGFQVLGRTTCPEFGLTLTTESVARGITRNPWDTERIAGGSSGGSAALVAAGVVPLAHTNDGAGSTRIPASCCGNVGLKTSRGRVSLGPLMNDLTSPLIAEGCNSRTVRDTAAFLDAVSRPARGEGNLADCTRGGPFLDILDKPPRTYRIAVDFGARLGIGMDFEVRSELERIAESLRSLGHTVAEAAPDPEQFGASRALATFWFSMAYTTVATLAPLTGKPVDSNSLELVTMQMVRAGEKVTNLDMYQAMATANQLSRHFGEFFDDWDLLLTPTFFRKTPNVGGLITLQGDVSLEEWVELVTQYVPSTGHANITGIPAISVPCGVLSDDLPLGMQFLASMGREDSLIDIARQLEESEPWKARVPEVFVA